MSKPFLPDPQQWWVLRYSPGPEWPVGAPPEVSLAGHTEFIVDLHRRGHVIAAGPTPDRPDTAQTVVRGLDGTEVHTVVQSDPAVADRRLLVDIIPWTVVLLGSGIG